MPTSGSPASAGRPWVSHLDPLLPLSRHLLDITSDARRARPSCKMLKQRLARQAILCRRSLLSARASALMVSLRSGLLHSVTSVAAVGLVTSMTGSQADTVLGCVSWSGKAPSPGVLGGCVAVDEKAAALLSQRDQALLMATAALLVRISLHSLPHHIRKPMSGPNWALWPTVACSVRSSRSCA